MIVEENNNIDLQYLLKLEVEGNLDELNLIYKKWISNNIKIAAKKKNIELFFERIFGLQEINLQAATNADSSKHVESSSNEKYLKKNKIAGNENWAAIITLWKRKNYFEEQIRAIELQSIKPQHILVIINENYIDKSWVKSVAPNAVIITSDINSLYTRWMIGYLLDSDYLSVFDDDVIPGQDWISNATRACKAYDAIIGPVGRIYNYKGNHDYYEEVAPTGNSIKNRLRDCSNSDIFCDWVCNSYFFKRDWINKILSTQRYDNSHQRFDDIQLCVMLQQSGHRCVVPAQPIQFPSVHGSIKPNYGQDEYAIWKNDSNEHYADRKNYLEYLIGQGYVPVTAKKGLHKIIIILVLQELVQLEKCLRSIKAQVYSNYQLVIIDSTSERSSVLDTIRKAKVLSYIYVESKRNIHSLEAGIIGIWVSEPNLGDIIINLNEFDVLANPHVLSTVEQCFRLNNIQAIYGNGIKYTKQIRSSFESIEPIKSSIKWNFNSDLDGPEYNLEKVESQYLQNGWRMALWAPLQLKAYLYSGWLKSSKEHYIKNSRYIKADTNAIFISVLSAIKYENIDFIHDILFCHFSRPSNHKSSFDLSENEKLEIRNLIAKSNFLDQSEDLLLGIKSKPIPILNFKNNDFEVIKSKFDYRNITSDGIHKRSNKKHSVISIVTPNYLADGILAVNSFKFNSSVNVHAYLYVADLSERLYKELMPKLFEIGIEVLIDSQLINSQHENDLSGKYGNTTDEYRWAMKPLLLMELVDRGFKSATFVDPDLYTTSDITDVLENIENYKCVLFPHFRNPDDELLRSILYRDGFFNGGLISINEDGYEVANNLLARCKVEMTKDASRNRWDDQKYFDLVILESNGVFVNLDKGIDYNPWNFDDVDGLRSIELSSFLLSSGSFARIWHVSTDLINQSIDLQQRMLKHRPVVFGYILLLCVTCAMVRLFLSDSKNLFEIGLNERYEQLRIKLYKLARSPEIEFFIEKFRPGKDEFHKFDKLPDDDQLKIINFINILKNYTNSDQIIIPLAKLVFGEKFNSLLKNIDAKHVNVIEFLKTTKMNF